MGLKEQRVNAVILAGGINRIPLYAGYEPGPKALLKFAGKPSVLYTLEALRRVPQVDRICLVGPAEALRQAVGEQDGCEYEEAVKSLGGNIILGLQHFGGSPAVLFATADMPLITSEAVGAFLDACAEKSAGDGEVFVVFVPEAAFTGFYQGRQKARVFFRDFIACHGNLALVDPRVTEHLWLAPRINHLYRVRKQTLRTTLAFGWTVAGSYLIGGWLLRRLTLEQMAGIASRRLGLRLVPVLLDRPELVIDVDEAKDYAFVRKRLEGDIGPVS